MAAGQVQSHLNDWDGSDLANLSIHPIDTACFNTEQHIVFSIIMHIQSLKQYKISNTKAPEGSTVHCLTLHF